jgi:hypothetical protein
VRVQYLTALGGLETLAEEARDLGTLADEVLDTILDAREAILTGDGESDVSDGRS